MLIASVVSGVEAAGLDQQLAGGVARPNRQAAVVRAEDAADRSQTPQVPQAISSRLTASVAMWGIRTAPSCVKSDATRS